MKEARQEGRENVRNYVNKKKGKEKKKGLIEKPMEKMRMEDRKQGWNKQGKERKEGSKKETKI